ncbi:MAG TPA: FAD-dependent oxidoreductase, partial [Ramlibacter sp.]|nr:FAD-dependent oxidoreductase [Ramlibacter sp.]
RARAGPGRAVGAAARLLPSRPAGVGRRLAALLAQRGIGLHLGQPVVAVDAGGVVTADGGRHPADEVLWVTAAAAAPWLAGTGLALDTGGFVRVHRTLQSITDARVFAAGDVAAVDGWALEKAGVVAVRQAPVLADNLRRAAAGQALRPWKPQRDWLAILGTGDGRAIATRGPLHAEGAWAWRWKQGIDRRFMRQFQQVLQ